MADTNGINASRANWVRAGVLGANDGIVSIAALIVGVASAYDMVQPIIITGLAGLVGGALSMAVGEYVSVSSQRDIEKAMVEKEEYELKNHPEQELEVLVEFYKMKGLSDAVAQQVAKELTDHDPLAAHAEMLIASDEEEFTNPSHAAIASGISFTLGGAIPLIAIIAAPEASRVAVTFVAALVALTITGILSARLSHAHPFKVTLRILIGGTVAMLITAGLGGLLKSFGL